MVLEDELKKLSKEIDSPYGGILNNFNSVLNRIKSESPTMSKDQQEEKALEEFMIRMRKNRIYAKLTHYEGVVLGISGLIDTVSSMRKKAIEEWAKDPTSAVKEGYTDSEGNPLDFRKSWSTGSENRGYGKLLPAHSFLSHAVGFGSIEGENKPKIFHILLTDRTLEEQNEFKEKFNVNKETMFKPVKFSGIDKSDPNDKIFVINPSKATKFELSNTQMPSVEKILDEGCKDLKIKLNELQDWYNKNKSNRNAVFIVDVDVTSISPTPNANNNRIINVDDFEISTSPVRCWISDEYVDFGESSRITIIGQCTETNMPSPMSEPTQEKELMINTMGVYVRRLVRPEAQELKEEHLKTPEKVGGEKWVS